MDHDRLDESEVDAERDFSSALLGAIASEADQSLTIQIAQADIAEFLLQLFE
jgi:hypothetical protein